MRPPPTPRSARDRIAREAARACVVVAIYLALYPVWTRIGARAGYLDLVLRTARAIVVATEHFPVSSGIDRFRIQYLDCQVVLVLCCFAASLRLDWRTRLRRFGMAIVLIYVLHVLAAVLGTRSGEASALLADGGLALFLPWELQILVMVKYLLYDLGIQLAPFLLMAITAGWNAGLLLARPTMRATADRAQDPRAAEAGPAGVLRWRRAPLAVLGALFVFGAALRVWSLAREHDPRHVRTHVVLGRQFASRGQWIKAREQYRAAMEGGSTDGRVFYDLARIESRSGNRAESLRLLRRGLEVVEEGDWCERLWEAAAEGAGWRPE